MPLKGEAKKIYSREWMRKRRAEWFADKVCAVCGTSENLELDHIDPTTKVTHKVWSWTYTRRMAELAKCQALCEECHKKKSADALRTTHCIRGHLKDGGRCRECDSLRHRRNREAKNLARSR